MAALVWLSSLAGCTTPDPGDEYEDIPTWCDPTREWSDVSRTLEDDVRLLINEYRSGGAKCGGETFAPAAPLSMAPKLRCAARMHSADMAALDYYGHESPDGEDLENRLALAEYEHWSAVEALARQSEDAEDIVAAWLANPSECRKIMSPEYDELGVGFVRPPLWTVVLAAPVD